MGLIKTILIIVATISILTFVAFFGRLPAFRNTPISFAHHMLWVHIPQFIRDVDQRLTNGRVTATVFRWGNYLFYENHPIVMIFFLGLVTIAAAGLLSNTYANLPLKHKIVIPPLLSTPYILTFLCSSYSASSARQIINPRSLARHLRAYPFDYVLFQPNRICSTCDQLKPARSKHCSLCKVCVARSDHHCAWVNNCVGKSNTRWFCLLLLSMTVLCLYGSFIAWISLRPMIRAEMDVMKERRLRFEQLARSRGRMVVGGADDDGWLDTFTTVLAIAVQKGGMSVAGVGMLTTLTWPMPFGLLVYHIYLIWSGMTTNESSKWDDVKEDMREGLVFIGARTGRKAWVGVDESEAPRGRDAKRAATNKSSHAANADGDYGEEWPARSRHFLVLTDNGEMPDGLAKHLADDVDEGSWKRGWRLAEVDNIYDLGFWDNLADVAKGR